MRVITNERLQQLTNDIQVGQHYVNTNHGSNADDLFFPYACEGWALRGLDNSKVNIQAVFNWINTGQGENPFTNTEYALMATEVKASIREQFGYHPDHYNTISVPQPHPMQVGVNPERQGVIMRRNELKAALHNCTAMVFELCLQANGFVLSDESRPTDYMVCIEYECAPTQPMYPNFTHAWLMIQRGVIVQKITNSKISITRSEAGRQPHCGLIRRYVTHLHDLQADVIEGILVDLGVTHAHVTNCNDTDIRTLQLPLNSHSPVDV